MSPIVQKSLAILFLCIFLSSEDVFSAVSVKNAASPARTYQTANKPSLEVPLITSVTQSSGAGTPSFSRPDTFDYSATVTDWENMVRPVLKNEARFVGARRVQNLLTSSDLIGTIGTGTSPTYWSITGIDYGALGIDKEKTKFGSNYFVKIRQTPAGGFQGFQQNQNWQLGRKYIFSAYIRVPSGVTASGAFLYFGNATPGTIQLASNAVLAAQSKDVWVRYSVPITVTASVTNIVSIINPGHGVGTGFDIAAPQLELVEGQSNQNPSEYVSTGVTGGPRSHGQVSVDGVQYFSTTNGNTVNGNNKVIVGTGVPLTPANGISPLVTDEYGPFGYLAEGSRTNLFVYSDQFNDSSWIKAGSSITQDATTSPEGKVTADKLVEASGLNQIYIRRNLFGMPTLVPWSLSVYAKAAERSNVVLYLDDGAGNSVAYNFNLTTETYSPTRTPYSAWSDIVVSMRKSSNGFYRLNLSGYRSGSETNLGVRIAVSDGTSFDVFGLPYRTGDGASGVYIWGAQLEQSTFPTTYIPTTASQVTRASDILTYPLTSNSNDSSGTVSIDVTPYWTGGASSSLYFIDSTVDNHDINLWHWGGAANHLAFDRDASNETRNNADTQCGANIVYGSLFKIAGRWSSAANSIFCNGALSASRIPPTLPYKKLTGSLLVGGYYYADYSQYAQASLRNLKLWKKDLATAEVSNLTKLSKSASQSATKKVTINVNQSSKNTSGLIGAWSFNGLAVQEKIVSDESGNGNDIKLISKAVPVPGKVGQAISSLGGFFMEATTTLDGTSFPQTAGTISMWLKADCSSQTQRFFLDEYTVDRRHIFFRCYTATTTQLVFQNGGSYAAVSQTAFKNKEWNHVVITYDTTTDQVAQYVNGAQVYSATLTDSTWVPDGQKIAPGTTYGDAFKGFIDEYRIYNRVLPSTEVTSLYKMGK